MADHKHTPKQRAKLKRLIKKGHSPAGARHLVDQAAKEKKIAYYGQGRETADAILRRLKRKRKK